MIKNEIYGTRVQLRDVCEYDVKTRPTTRLMNQTLQPNLGSDICIGLKAFWTQRLDMNSDRFLGYKDEHEQSNEQ